MTRPAHIYSLLCAAFFLGAAVVGSVAVSAPDLHFPIPEASAYEWRAPSEAGGGSGEAIRKINLNTAGSAELEALPGIGPKTARAILDYRKEHGRFHTRRDLMKVKGIGEKTYEKVKDQIVTGGP